jgi:hypothetical protein
MEGCAGFMPTPNRNQSMSLFASKSQKPTKADALAKLRADIEAAAACANKFGIDAREIATILEGQSEYYRQRDAMFRSVL